MIVKTNGSFAALLETLTSVCVLQRASGSTGCWRGGCGSWAPCRCGPADTCATAACRRAASPSPSCSPGSCSAGSGRAPGGPCTPPTPRRTGRRVPNIRGSLELLNLNPLITLPIAYNVSHVGDRPHQVFLQPLGQHGCRHPGEVTLGTAELDKDPDPPLAASQAEDQRVGRGHRGRAAAGQRGAGDLHCANV